MEPEDEDIIYGIDVPGRNVPELSVATQELLRRISSLTSDATQNLIYDHLHIYTKQNALSPIEFNRGLEWFNVSESLTFEKYLSGHIVVLDFFTYCCINCLHILPDLERLEHSFPPNNSPVLVVGIHSGKFDNERVSTNVSDALKKFGITHPVANDVNCDLWQRLEICCWPTLLVVGPGGLPLFVLMGEGNGEFLMTFVSATISFFELQRSCIPKQVPLKPEERIASIEDGLRYPGKVDVFSDKLVISDSGNNRIIIANTDGDVQHVIGSGRKGLRDGNFESVSFSNPQGVVYHPSDVVFVADTDNHAIRKICLKAKNVETIAGTGKQGKDTNGGNMWTEQAISSPWDVALGHTLDADAEDPPNVLLIAMAGSHQIWAVFLSAGKWLKNSYFEKGTVVRLAGSGLEENRNTSYPLKAGFAQPSGITVASTKDGPTAFVADSESSSVRQISCTTGAVSRVAGGGLDPNDLFAFGEEDGVSSSARFQHPLGVAFFDDVIYVADTYNHKIRSIRRREKKFETATLLGGTKTENFPDDQYCLREPGGLCVNEDGTRLYVADTNNFCIKEFNFAKNELKTVNLKFHSASERRSTLKEEDIGETFEFSLERKLNQITLRIHLNLPNGVHLTPDAETTYSITNSGNVSSTAYKGTLWEETALSLQVDMSQTKSEHVVLSTRLFLCLDEGVCTSRPWSALIKFSGADCASDHFNINLNPRL